MHKVFISFHHLDQIYKDWLVNLNNQNHIFIDKSVNTGGIAEHLPDQSIRQIIRDDYLQDTTVTIVLVGRNTKGRKHVDWEIYSSMYDGVRNKRSGVVVILLPEGNPNNNWVAAHENEKVELYPGYFDWFDLNTRQEYENRFPFMPDRLLENLVENNVKISVAPWDRINADTLRTLLDNAYLVRERNQYNLQSRMRRANSPLI